MTAIRKSLDTDAASDGVNGTNQPDNDIPASCFNAQDLTNSPAWLQLPDEIWLSILYTTCPFAPEFFLDVIKNLTKNPNVTSTLLFRADIFYDSLNDVTVSDDASAVHFSEVTEHMKASLRPLRVWVPGFQRRRTWVRQLVPRNPQVDRSLVQTVHLYSSKSPESEKHLVLYLPHVQNAEEIPFYHPSVQAVALLHDWDPRGGEGRLSIHYRLFETHPLDTRLQRTALNLLRIIHKHGVGQMRGYTKRVHHDILVPQKVFQDTYARLKSKHARRLIAGWAEQTDPTKHVFEDLGIAAFLMELWADMYGAECRAQGSFPGFVDIGCGNGVLVDILLREGYRGWGFDARRRKSWAGFAEDTQRQLKVMILVPQVLQDEYRHRHPQEHDDEQGTLPFHNGVFTKGTFIISNHADELTPWTPLLTYRSGFAPFIAIPCCSHDLSGVRTRFGSKHSNNNSSSSGNNTCPTETQPSSPQPGLNRNTSPSSSISQPPSASQQGSSTQHRSLPQAARRKSPERGSIPQRAKQPSAYSALTTYIDSLATELGYAPEKEMLRIPSTRNTAIVGRRLLPNLESIGEWARCAEEASPSRRDADDQALAQRDEVLRRILQREVGDLGDAARMWIERARGLAEAKGKGH